MTRLDTARLTLRPLEVVDLDDFAEMMSHPDVYPMMGFGSEPDGTKRARTLEVELFYGLKREWWDHGIMREATEAIVRYAFETLKLRRLTSVCFRENVRSANVMRRIGMTVGPHPGNPDGEMLGVLDNPAAPARRAE